MGMKKFLICLMSACVLRTAAQEPEQNITLGEVTVEGARSVRKADGMWVYPTQQQIAHSANGYSLLAKLALPHIRVDEAMNTVTALSSLGAVQVRINGIEASREDLRMLDIAGVELVEYIDNPGVRYGDDVAYVINIKVRKPEGGYILGAQLTNTLTAINGSESLYGKVNRGRSELALSYDLDYHNFKEAEYDERADYLLESGDCVSFHRESMSRRSRQLSHNAQLTYSLSDSDYVFQARLSGSHDMKPLRNDADMTVNIFVKPNDQSQNLFELWHGGKMSMQMNGIPYGEHSRRRGSSPALDLYYHRDFDSLQSLTANAVGTYIRTTGRSEDNEITAYSYDIDGQTCSLWSEAVYENRMKPFTLSAGLQYGQRFSRNVYEGDADAVNTMRSSLLYVFSQLKGYIGRLSYMGGLGISRRYYRQADTRQTFRLFRPKVSRACPLTSRLRANYSFEISQRVSQIALVSDVSIRRNAMETILGNPGIRPTRVTSHQIRLSYSTPHFTSELLGHCRLNAHCNMEKYIRENGRFYQTQTNAGNECDLLYVSTYNRWDILPGRLSATVYGGVYRFLNFGEDYTHTYTALNGGCSVHAYLGHWTLGAYADNGWNFMEGERRGHQAPAWYISGQYRLGDDFSVALFVQHPFSQHPLTNRVEILSRYVQKEITGHSRDYGNMVSLRLSWRFERGRRYRDIERSMNHSDTETGILSK